MNLHMIHKSALPFKSCTALVALERPESVVIIFMDLLDSITSKFKITYYHLLQCEFGHVSKEIASI